MRFLAFIGLMFAGSLIAVAQRPTPELSDTTLRAAYCVGVLKHQMESLKDTQLGCEAAWSERKYKSLEDCQQTEGIIQGLSQFFKEKHRRYAQYVAIRTMEASEGQTTMLQAVIRKGEVDARAKDDAPLSPATKACYSREVTDLVGCVAKHDQTHASVMRCQHSPDQLPF